MEFVANAEKNVEIEVSGDIYLRHAIQTRFITGNDSYIDIMKEYVAGIYQEGDIISISEKIISICQNRTIRREDIKIGRMAKFLSKFAIQAGPEGYGVGVPIKMQYAINKIGLLRIIFASVAGGLFKVFGIKGIFYKIAGPEISGLDGFYDGAWEEYRDIGIELPYDSTAVCNEIKQKLGISCMIVDANDLGQEILGKSDDIKFGDRILKQMIRDNPAGQDQQRTPLILIREKRDSKKGDSLCTVGQVSTKGDF